MLHSIVGAVPLLPVQKGTALLLLHSRMGHSPMQHGFLLKMPRAARSAKIAALHDSYAAFSLDLCLPCDFSLSGVVTLAILV